MFVSLTTDVVTHAFNVFPATGEDKLKDIDKVKEMKRQELSRACKVLGVQSWKLLDFPENPMLSGFDEYSTVIELIREFRPDVVLCPHPTEYGRHDHMDACRFVVACVDYARVDEFSFALAAHA
jgi:LmbE family N-acetylglucosaminyl deacetylase